MAVNAGPLTTIFQPPAACTDTVTSAGGSLFVGNWASYQANDCYPPTTAEFDYGQGDYYWSPGVCPQGYTTACSFSDVIFKGDTTASLCCPEGYQCHSVWGNVCLSVADSTLSNVYMADDGTAYGGYVTAITPDYGAVVYEDGIPVAWQSTDIAVLTLFGLPTPSALPSSSLPSSTAADGSSTTGQETGTQTTSGSQSEATTSVPTVVVTMATPTTTSQSANGMGPILTGTCSETEWTLMDVSTAFLWAPVIGCVQDKTGCCPFTVAPASTALARHRRAASTAAPSGPFPTASGSAANEMIAQCPQDYVSVSGGCCPSGQTVYTNLFGAQTACASQAVITAAPTIPNSILLPIEAPAGYPTTKPISTITDMVFAMELSLAPPSSGLSLAARIGIGVGAGVVGLIIIGAIIFLAVRCIRNRDHDSSDGGSKKKRRNSSWVAASAPFDHSSNANKSTFPTMSEKLGDYGSGIFAVARSATASSSGANSGKAGFRTMALDTPPAATLPMGNRQGIGGGEDFQSLGSPVDDGAPWQTVGQNIGPVPGLAQAQRLQLSRKESGGSNQEASGRMSPAGARGAIGGAAAGYGRASPALRSRQNTPIGGDEGPSGGWPSPQLRAPPQQRATPPGSPSPHLRTGAGGYGPRAGGPRGGSGDNSATSPTGSSPRDGWNETQFYSGSEGHAERPQRRSPPAGYRPDNGAYYGDGVRDSPRGGEGGLRDPNWRPMRQPNSGRPSPGPGGPMPRGPPGPGGFRGGPGGPGPGSSGSGGGGPRHAGWLPPKPAPVRQYPPHQYQRQPGYDRGGYDRGGYDQGPYNDQY